jgi:hypothetical protein
MAEFERIESSDPLYSDSVEALPIIIRYRQTNVEWNDKQLANASFEQLMEEYSGRHECYFINKGLDKKTGKQLIQLMISESDYKIKLTQSKDGRYFYNPTFEEEKFVLPIDENEYKVKVCNVIFSKDEEDIIDIWTKIGWLNRVQEIKNFIDSCSSLQRPLKEIRMEEDRQIWQAYIDGLNALNDSKKELFKIKSIGKIRKDKDFRGKPIKSITIELESANQNANLKDDILELFSNQFETAPKVTITQKTIRIEYDSYRVISEDLLSDLEDIVKENCYVIVEDQPVYRLSGSIELKLKRSDYDVAKEKLDTDLASFGADYTKNDDEYVFTNDEEENFFEKLVAKDYSNYIKIERSTSLVGKFSFSDEGKSDDVIANINSIKQVRRASYQSGFVIVEAIEALNLEDDIFSSLLFSSCRIKVTPQKFDPNIHVLETLEPKNEAYYSTITDLRKVSKQPNGWKYSVMNAYQKAGNKTWVNLEYFYAFKIGIDKALLRPLQLHFLEHEKINVNSVKGEVELLPISASEFIELQKEVEKELPVGLSVCYPAYKISCKLRFLIDDESMCKKTFKDIGNSLSNIRFDHYSFAKESNAKVCFDLTFKTEEERDRYISEINRCMQEHENLAGVNYDSLEGSTIISFALDEKLLDERNKRLQRDFSNEQVNYVSAKYDEIRNTLGEDRDDNLEDDDEDEDWYATQRFESQVRAAQNKFKRNAPNIGTCLLRTPESVKINVSDSFIEQIQDGEVKLEGGYLQFPVIGSSMELYRQKSAMDKITNPGGTAFGNKQIGYPANRNLPNFLFDPRYADDTEADIDEEKAKIANSVIEKGLNDKQLEAVTKAVIAKDMAFIQGPPGTGKTTVIAEIIWQEVLKNKDCRILLTSQTNLAVDNALERLQGKRGIRPVRIVPQSKTEKLEREGRRYLLPLIDSWKENDTKENSDNAVNLWIDTIHDNISANTKYSEVLAQWKKDLETKDEYIRQTFAQSYKSKVNLVAATCSICGSREFLYTYQALYGTENEPYFDVVIMDEASKATPLEMAVPMVLGKKIIVIGDHKQLPPMMDENSIDTALKKIGRNELAEKLENIKESQFKRLFEAAQKVRKNLVATLDTQYRMHEQIMQTINHFYKDDLINGLQCGIKETMDEPDFTNKGSRYHGLDFKNIFRPDIHAIWINVHSPEKKEGTSYTNPAELDAIKLVIEALEKSEGYSRYINSLQKPEDKEIGLITFYSSQKRGIKDMQKQGKLGDSSFRIDVVDKFQGMERNIVIVSTVRSNKQNKMGFADRIERINVAFSRAKRLLVVIGDKQFFEKNENYRKSIAAMEVVDVKQLRDALK